MVNVNPVDGITYRFRLIGYLIAVFVAGFIIIAICGVLVDSGGDAALVGGLVALAGMATIFAGFLGMQYKIIADAVEKGTSAANSNATAGHSRQPRRGARNRSQGGQQSGTTQQQQRRQRPRQQRQRRQQQGNRQQQDESDDPWGGR